MADQYTERDNPRTESLSMQAQREKLEICRDVFAGTLRLREKADIYLPRWPKEPDGAYLNRVSQAVLYNAFRQTVLGLTGMVYRVPPKVGEQVPPEIVTDLEDIDLQGGSLTSFGSSNLEDAWCDGHALIFVDMERVEGGTPRRKSEERALGLRPYWVAVQKADVLRARPVRIAGRMMLGEIAWLEHSEERTGRFREEVVTRIRELELVEVEGTIGVEWRLLRQKKRGDDRSWAVEAQGLMRTQQGRPYPEIPVCATYTSRHLAPFQSDPPLLDLATENLRHFRKLSDQDNVEHVTCVPILSLSGVGPDEFDSLSVGPTIGIRFSDPAGRAVFAETNGKGAELTRESLRDIERRMAVLGLSMLAPETPHQQTATWKRIEKSESDSRLAKAAESHQVALNEALRFHALWRGLELDEDEVWIRVNRDFEGGNLPPEVMKVYVDAVARAGLPPRLLLEIWQDGGRIPADKDIDELEAEMLAGGAAVETDAAEVL